MKQKAFTLIELLAVIVILAIILLIAVPQVLNVIESAEASSYKAEEDLIKKAAKTYLTMNTNFIPENIGEKKEFSIEELKDANLIESQRCSGYIIIKKESENNYEINPYLKCDDAKNIDSSLEDGLVLHYDFNGDILDNSSNNISGVLHGTDFISGKNGKENEALFFDGDYDYIDLGDNSVLKPSNITYAAWVKPTNFSEQWAGIITTIPSWGTGLGLQVGTAQNISAMVSGNYLKTSYVPLINNWYHIVVTHDSSDNMNKLYVNGVLENSFVRTVTYASGAKTIIGAFYTTTSLEFEGVIDDIRIYSRALSEEEVKLLYFLNY